MQRRHRIILGSSLGILILATLLMARACMSTAPLVYTTATVRRQDIKDTVAVNGEIQARTRVNVGTSVTAEIRAIHVKDGDMVNAGDLLVTLDQERLKQELQRAQLELTNAKEDLALTEAAWKRQDQAFSRQESLHASGLVAQDDFQGIVLSHYAAETNLRKAKVALQQAKASVALAEDALSKTLIRAPMAGKITGLKAERGETAIAGLTNLAGAVLMVISDVSDMLAEVKVSEVDVIKLKPGQPAEIQVDALPAITFHGVVMEVANGVDRPTAGTPSAQDAQNYRVRVRIQGTKDELTQLRSGMSARVVILAREIKQVPSVPLQAIQEREAKRDQGGLMSGTRSVAWVVQQGKVSERTLTLGIGNRRLVQVLDGLKEGEQVITGPTKAMASLRPSQTVIVQSETDASKAKRP